MVSDELAQALSDCVKKLPDHLLDELFQTVHPSPGSTNLDADGIPASRRHADPSLDTLQDRRRREDRVLGIGEAVLAAHEINVEKGRASPIAVTSVDAKDMRREVEHLSPDAPNLPARHFEKTGKQGKKQQPVAHYLRQAVIAGIADWYESRTRRQRYSALVLLYRAQQVVLGHDDPEDIAHDSKEVTHFSKNVANWKKAHSVSPVSEIKKAYQDAAAGELLSINLSNEIAQDNREQTDKDVIGAIVDLLHGIE